MAVTLPVWAEELRARYLAGESSMFLLHGNVRDLQPWVESEGAEPEWVGLRSFLERFLARTRDVVAYYNVSQGIRFPNKAHEKTFRLSVDARRQLHGEPSLSSFPKHPGDVLPLFEALVTDPLRSSGVILDYFETVAPRADLAYLTHDDKANLVSMRRWSSDPAFVSTDNIVILVTESLPEVAQSVVASPQLVTIRVPYADSTTRQTYLESVWTDQDQAEMPISSLAQVTAGLTLVQTRSILQVARQSGETIRFDTVNQRKKRIIERECHGLVEFVAPRHDFTHVGGMERVKADLSRVAEAVKSGQVNRVPMGMIFVGPMGTGKTFVAEAFAAESGLTCLKFKNFRDKWVGSTESNLERVLDLVEALGYVLLIIDEADRALSTGDNDGGVGSRVIARLKEFMSDTSHRGRIVMLMMSNRPDKLDTDLKRPGRFDLRIPFFFPEQRHERLAILEALSRKNDVHLEDSEELGQVAAVTEGYSGAELEAVLLAAVAESSRHGRDVVAPVDLATALEDVIPSRDVRMLRYMELLAVFECSSRRMLPDQYQAMPTSEVLSELDDLKMQLGRRVM